MKKKCIQPATLFESLQYGFSQVVTAKAQQMVFISGQVAWDHDQALVGENDLKLQTEKSMENLKNAIVAAGGTLENIVMLRIYKVNYQPEDASIISEVLRNNFGKNPPASTWLSVAGLADKDFMIEIEAQAVL